VEKGKPRRTRNFEPNGESHRRQTREVFMTRRLTAILLAAILTLACVGLVFAAMSAFDIAKKSSEMEKTKSRVATYKMTVTNDRGKSRTYQFKIWEKQFAEGSKKLIRFEEPSDAKGTGLLTHEVKGKDDLQWLYLPSRKSVRQLAASDKSDQFMGSDLFIEDMGEISAEDYDHAILKDNETVDGSACYVIESKPKAGINTAYGKSVASVDKANFGGRKMEIFDKSMKLLKVIHAMSIEQVQGVWTIRKIEVTTPEKKTKTALELIDVQYNKDVPDGTFTTQSLERY
jgi:outer membrane lipoprotein-sorting protein